jgi:hypothetical protein
MMVHFHTHGRHVDIIDNRKLKGRAKVCKVLQGLWGLTFNMMCVGLYFMVLVSVWRPTDAQKMTSLTLVVFKNRKILLYPYKGKWLCSL